MSLISVLSESAQTKRGKGGGEGCLLGGGGRGNLFQILAYMRDTRSKVVLIGEKG